MTMDIGYFVFTFGNVFITISSLPQWVKIIKEGGIKTDNFALLWPIITSIGLTSFSVSYILMGWWANLLFNLPGNLLWLYIAFMKVRRKLVKVKLAKELDVDEDTIVIYEPA